MRHKLVGTTVCCHISQKEEEGGKVEKIFDTKSSLNSHNLGSRCPVKTYILPHPHIYIHKWNTEVQYVREMSLTRINTINTKGSVYVAISVFNVSCAITGCDVKTEGKSLSGFRFSWITRPTPMQRPMCLEVNTVQVVCMFSRVLGFCFVINMIYYNTLPHPTVNVSTFSGAFLISCFPWYIAGGKTDWLLLIAFVYEIILLCLSNKLKTGHLTVTI